RVPRSAGAALYDAAAAPRKGPRPRKARSFRSALLRGRLAALATGGDLLSVRPALGRAAPRRGVGLLAAAARGPGRVRDPRRPPLRHPLVLERLVLLLVLHVCTLAGHDPSFRVQAYACSMPADAQTHIRRLGPGDEDVLRTLAEDDEP